MELPTTLLFSLRALGIAIGVLLGVYCLFILLLTIPFFQRQ
jgi:hypothetical protein